MNATAPAMPDINHALEYASAERRRDLSENERALLRVALKAFAQHGYAATSARKVSVDAGLTAPMVNYYFGSKKGLYKTVGKLIFSALVAEVQQAVDGVEGFEAQVRAIIGAHVEFGERSPYSVEFICMAMYGPMGGHAVFDPYTLGAPVAQLSRDLVARAVTSGELVLAEDIEVEYVLTHMWGIVRNALLGQVREHRRERVGDPERAASGISRADVARETRIFLAGIRA